MKGMTLRHVTAALFFLLPGALWSRSLPWRVRPSGSPGNSDSCSTFRLPAFLLDQRFRGRGVFDLSRFGLTSPHVPDVDSVYTGREEFPAGSAKPADGWLPLGGASLEDVFPRVRPTVRPYGTAGYGLYTIAEGMVTTEVVRI